MKTTDDTTGATTQITYEEILRMYKDLMEEERNREPILVGVWFDTPEGWRYLPSPCHPSTLAYFNEHYRDCPQVPDYR